MASIMDKETRLTQTMIQSDSYDTAMLTKSDPITASISGAAMTTIALHDQTEDEIVVTQFLD